MSRVVAVPRVSERMHRRCECIVIVDVQRYTCAMLRKHYVNNNKRALCVCVCRPTEQRFDADCRLLPPTDER